MEEHRPSDRRRTKTDASMTSQRAWRNYDPKTFASQRSPTPERGASRHSDSDDDSTEPETDMQRTLTMMEKLALKRHQVE